MVMITARSWMGPVGVPPAAEGAPHSETARPCRRDRRDRLSGGSVFNSQVLFPAGASPFLTAPLKSILNDQLLFIARLSPRQALPVVPPLHPGRRRSQELGPASCPPQA